jgi:AAA15 family ATPase/GTPase
MGDGMWRMFVLAVAITQCKDGTLLVDEIDTGLHYSVMAQMWKLIFDAAKEFNVQVFATTHSYDCVYSLAHICAKADEGNHVTVQRIETGKTKAIPYAEYEIKVAADREIEVR